MAKKSNKRASSPRRYSSSSKKAKKQTPAPKAHTGPLFSIHEGFWQKNWPAIAILVLMSFILYGQSMSYEYVLDDKMVVTENAYTLEGFAGIADIFAHDSFKGYLDKIGYGNNRDLVAGSRYRPLSLATFAIETAIFGQKPAISHFFNILLYALTGILLYQILLALFPLKDPKKWYQSVAFIGALLFLLHPIHSEVVANVKGRDEILALLFSLAALYFVLKAASTESNRWKWGSGLMLFIGLMAKENAITFLAVVPFTLYFFTKADIRQSLSYTLPALVATILFVAIRYKVVGTLLGGDKVITEIMNNPFAGTTTGERFATVFYTLGVYVKLLIFPHPLTHDYYPYHIPILTWADPRAWLSLILYLGMGAYALMKLKQKTVPAYCIIFYLATLSIVSNLFFSIGAFMNERFAYMPSVAFCLLLAYLLMDRLPTWTAKKDMKVGWLGYVLVGVFAVGFMVKTFERLPAWKDAFSLNVAAAKVSVNSARANSYYAYALYQKALKETDPEKEQALYQEALPYVTRALEIHPRYDDAFTTKAGVVAGLYKKDKDLDRLLQVFYDILKVKEIPFIWKQYLPFLNKRAPDMRKLMNFYHNIGYEWFLKTKRQPQGAIKYLELGREASPNDSQLLADLTEAYYLNKNYTKSINAGTNVQQRRPNDARVFYFVGKSYEKISDTENAKAYLDLAYEMDPSLR